ncbi:MAG: DUF4493 domain-containing protein [Bacteroidaceae bacterium]|nr:DUF4493 domain-containing protein [Bacteroidaceae bacterium]
MKRLAYIFLLPLLLACSNEEMPANIDGEGTLVLADLSRQEVVKSVVKTRNTVDADLAIEILASDGNVYRGYQYAAGASLPDNFSLIPATYTLHAYSENAATWTTDNDGRGSAVYEIRQDFNIQADWVTYLDVQVPMTNYGVTYTVPEGFENWFPTCQFTVTGDSRTCPLTADQAAYFDPANTSGFSFTLHLVNTDGQVYDIEQQTYENPKAGLLYNVTYTFASDDDPTKLKIGISYDDTYEELVSEITLY